MSLQTAIADPADYRRATKRKVTNARYFKALALTDLAESICRVNDTSAESLSTLTDLGWLRLAEVAGVSTRKVPSPETQAMVVRMVAQRLRRATVAGY